VDDFHFLTLALATLEGAQIITEPEKLDTDDQHWRSRTWGQSGPSTRLGECQAGVQASLAINPSRIVALQTWERCSILLTAIRPCAGTKRESQAGPEATPNTAWQRGAVNPAVTSNVIRVRRKYCAAAPKKSVQYRSAQPLPASRDRPSGLRARLACCRASSAAGPLGAWVPPVKNASRQGNSPSFIGLQ
jgi:hypothetical protein